MTVDASAEALATTPPATTTVVNPVTTHMHHPFNDGVLASCSRAASDELERMAALQMSAVRMKS